MKIFWFDKQEKTAAGGMGTYSREIINGLTQKGHEVIPLRFGDKLRPSDPQNTILLPYSIGDKSFYFLPLPKTLRIVKEAFAQNKPDVVHINFSVSPLDFSLPNLAHSKNIPVVGTLHQSISENKEISLETLGIKSYFLSHLACLSQLEKLLVFSSVVKNFFISKGIKTKHLEIFPNFVDCQKFRPGKSEFKKENKIDFAFLFLGRISFPKNPEVLIESFLKINPAPNQKLIMVGAGDIGSLYQDLRKEYKKHPQIIFTGAISDIKKKIDIIRAADVFVLPSSLEGMSFALLEAMACGLAPVVSDAGSHQEVVGNTGLVIEHNKVRDQLPVALQVFKKNPELAKVLGKKAREKAIKDYNQEVQIKKLIGIYKEVIQQRKSEKPKPSFFRTISSQLAPFREFLRDTALRH